MNREELSKSISLIITDQVSSAAYYEGWEQSEVDEAVSKIMHLVDSLKE